MSRRAKLSLWIAGGTASLFAMLALAVVLILPSAWLRERIRAGLVTEIEKTTGGRVEIGAFYWDWRKLHVQVRPFVLHGTESEGEKPLVRAEAIQVWLHIVSFLKRDIDVRRVEFDHPEVNVLIDAQGRTNFPTPKVQRKSDEDPVQQILNLAVKEFRIKDGFAHYGDLKIPIDLEARNLAAVFDYDFRGPRYHGTINMQRLNVKQGNRTPVSLALESKVTLAQNRVTVEQARMAMPHSYIEASGDIVNLRSPQVNLDMKALGDLAELGKPLNLPQPHTGSITFAGKASYSAAEGYVLSGKVAGRNLAIQQNGVSVHDIGITAAITLDERNLQLRGMTVSALDGRVVGQADIHDFKTYRVNGVMEGVSLQRASQIAAINNMPYQARLSGPFEVIGSLDSRSRDAKVAGTINVAPEPGAVPLQGTVQVQFDQRTQQVQLGDSSLHLPSTALNVRGTLGEDLHVVLQSSNLDEILPALAIGSSRTPLTLPVKLEKGGSVHFDGDVRGALSNPEIAGKLNVQNVTYESQKVDSLSATLSGNKAGLQIESVAMGQDQVRLQGRATIGLSDWKLTPASAVAGTITLRNAQLAQLIAKAGQNAPVDGVVTADMKLTGTYGDPHATGEFTVDNLTAYGEKFNRFRATVNYAGTGVELIKGELDQGTARIFVTGAYEHPASTWKNGRIRFDVHSDNWALQQIRHVEEFRPGVTGRLTVQAAGTAEIRNLDFLLNKLNGQVSVQNLVVDQKPIGNVAVNATTTGPQLAIGAAGDLRGSKVTGNGVFQLSGDYNGSGRMQISPMKLSTIQDLLTSNNTGAEKMPMEGTVTANLTFSGPARKPDLMHARLEIPTLEIRPSRQVTSSRQNQDLTLRNAGPILVEATGKLIRIQSAKLVGPDTNIEATGTVNVGDTKAPWDLKMNGNLNLAVLQDFQPGLISSGVSTMNASIRGSLAKPQLQGRLKLNDASFYIVDVPNGVDKVNGELIFDQNRATIVDRLTAETGGGQMAVSGFVGLGAGELTYRLQARAEDVRVRYPEGVSTTASAQLSLTGTTDHSMLTGIITVKRVGFNPRTDVGGLLASTATPVASPTTPNQFLRGLLLDLRVESVPNLQFQASMTNNLQAEVNLRVRGTAAKPALSGRINVNQGDITFFGTKYQINRGDIAFYNQAKIEPVIDLDLESRVRGILVNISLTGTLSKLNISYRSDPPLQSNEIVALLAVGRTPGTYSALAASQTVTQGSVLQTGGSALLGQAVTSPVSGRLQRFFGVSKLKIDPLLTGVNAIPQARLTLEQQISKDITLTYVQNIAQANQQIVRFEWNLNRNWSVVAVREENGVFGVDFFYKKTFR